MNKKDTNAWIMQSWLSFGIALVAAIYGVYTLNITDGWIKAFMIFGVFSSVASAFTVSKTIRDNKEQQRDTHAWIMQTWLTFGLTVFMTGAGLWNLTGDGTIKGYITVAYLFALSSAFTLAKTIRDNQTETTTKNPSNSNML
jgi:hypothetical protein